MDQQWLEERRKGIKLFPEPCPVCRTIFKKKRLSQKTCSFLCGAKFRSSIKVPDLNISELYTSGRTQQEIADSMGVSLKSIQKSLKRSCTNIRKAAKRNQAGEKNDNWAGSSVSYKGAHCRVRLHRGNPQQCEKCGVEENSTRIEWANVTGKYHDPADFISLCVRCHRGWDNKRRKENGTREVA